MYVIFVSSTFFWTTIGFMVIPCVPFYSAGKHCALSQAQYTLKDINYRPYWYFTYEKTEIIQHWMIKRHYERQSFSEEVWSRNINSLKSHIIYYSKMGYLPVPLILIIQTENILFAQPCFNNRAGIWVKGLLSYWQW